MERLTYDETDIDTLVKDARFLAAAHGYSLDLFPLGEAIVRARAGEPFVPATLSGTAYSQLVQDVAERIAARKIGVPEDLSTRFPDVYAEYTGPTHKKGSYIGPADLRFSALLSPEAKEAAFSTTRLSFNEQDIASLVANERFLASLDVYSKNLVTFGQAQKLMFGSDTFIPLNLSWGAFHSLCLETIDRMLKGTIKVPADLQDKFLDIYSSRPDK
jgi:hypothetical protein